jgi:hypothetical protein
MDSSINPLPVIILMGSPLLYIYIFWREKRENRGKLWKAYIAAANTGNRRNTLKAAQAYLDSLDVKYRKQAEEDIKVQMEVLLAYHPQYARK